LDEKEIGGRHGREVRHTLRQHQRIACLEGAHKQDTREIVGSEQALRTLLQRCRVHSFLLCRSSAPAQNGSTTCWASVRNSSASSGRNQPSLMISSRWRLKRSR